MSCFFYKYIQERDGRVYTIEKLHDVIEQSLIIPNEENISLKLYCDYFESYIDKCIYNVEIADKEEISIKISANRVPHILDLHAFYDKKLKDKRLRFPGSFSNADGYRNMKNSIITLETLKKAKKGAEWNKNTIRDRVLGFPYIRNAILKGDWYEFDVDNFEGETKVIADYIAVWKIGKTYFNFCFKKEDETNDYYCLSDIVVYKTNSRVKNQTLLDVERTTELKNGTIKEVVCHASHVKNILYDRRYSTRAIVDAHVHEIIYKESNTFNSVKVQDDKYCVDFLKIDRICKYIK